MHDESNEDCYQALGSEHVDALLLFTTVAALQRMNWCFEMQGCSNPMNDVFTENILGSQ